MAGNKVVFGINVYNSFDLVRRLYNTGSIPKEPEKSVFRLPRKLPRIDDLRPQAKLVRINAIRTNLRSSILGALARPKSRFFKFFGYNLTRMTIDWAVQPVLKRKNVQRCLSIWCNEQYCKGLIIRNINLWAKLNQHKNVNFGYGLWLHFSLY